MSTEPEEIPLVLNEYEEDARALERQLVQICWYMRGWDMQSAYSSTPSIRKAALKLIEENIERTKTSGLPLI